MRNKYCATCVRTEANQILVTPHDCAKNWPLSSSSSHMEALIIVDGFVQSEKMYGIRYNK